MPRVRCHFKHNGKPTTLPGTPDDKKRVALSRWITAMLVFNGDERPGDYTTPDAHGDLNQFIQRVSRNAHEPAD